MSGLLPNIQAAVERIQSLINSTSDRILIGIAGKPGAGKSTLSQKLLELMNSENIAVLSMDGFHLSNKVLATLGRADRKGAPDTFDVASFVSLLRRIRSERDSHIYFPIFDRKIEESIAAQGEINSETKLVLVEGNYLLHYEDGWQNVANILDEIWYIELDDELRIERLIARHMAFGKNETAAKQWACGSDERNADLIALGAKRANYVIRLD
jgi:pantothenate kinase